VFIGRRRNIQGGQISPNGCLFTLGCFFENYKSSRHLWATRLCINIGKNGLGNILGDFFAPSSGHPGNTEAFHWQEMMLDTFEANLRLDPLHTSVGDAKTLDALHIFILWQVSFNCTYIHTYIAYLFVHYVCTSVGTQCNLLNWYCVEMHLYCLKRVVICLASSEGANQICYNDFCSNSFVLLILSLSFVDLFYRHISNRLTVEQKFSRTKVQSNKKVRSNKSRCRTVNERCLEW
jgi:hypothetical protein